MKITIEIKDNKMLFDYEIAGGRHHSNTNLTPDHLVAFTDILRIASQANARSREEFLDELKAKAYLEKENKK